MMKGFSTAGFEGMWPHHYPDHFSRVAGWKWNGKEYTFLGPVVEPSSARRPLINNRPKAKKLPAVAPAAPGPAPFAPTPRDYEAGEFEAGPAAVLLSAVIPDAHHCSGWTLDS